MDGVEVPQKKSLRKMERQQQTKKDTEKKGGRVEKTIGSLDIPDMSGQELMEQLVKMKAITPPGLAIQLNIKISTAKKLLEQLKNDKVVDLASKSHNLKVYKLA
jgi:ribosomal protein S25